MLNNLSKKLLPSLLLVFLFQFFFFSFVLAADSSIQFKPQVSIPGFEGGPIGNTTAMIGEYIKAFYVFGISALALLSVVMIAWAGITWLTAGGSPEKVGTAKARILGALGGLALGLVSYVILQTINPALVDFKISSITPVDPLYMQNVITNKLCDAGVKDAQGKPIACGSIYAAKSPDITPNKEEQKIEGCMGYSCYEYPFVNCVACKLLKDTNGNYTSGGCLNDVGCDDPMELKNRLGQVSKDYYGYLDKQQGIGCGTALRAYDVRINLKIITYFWIGTHCPDMNRQTCILESDSVVLEVDEITSTTGLAGVPVRDMKCSPQ